MNRFGGTIIGISALSLVANGWLGFHLYRNTRILQMQAESYNNFKQSLNRAMTATDAAKADKPGSKALEFDTYQANMSLQQSMRTIWGLRTDFAKNGMDIYPIFLALVQSENYNPFDSDFVSTETQSLISKNSKTLHDLYSTLAPTSFTNSGLSELKQAVSSLYGKYNGYPSYSKLQ